MDKNFAKVQLSAEEMRLVTDPAWILTKNSIIAKVVAMFALLSERWQEMLRENRALSPVSPGMLALHVAAATAKISKGEQYKGLPYVMLDCPREFGREDVLAIRTLFWWGHAFSVTLHLKGIYQVTLLPVILERREELAAAGFELGVSEGEWEHGHLPENYRPWVGAEELGATRPFLKLSARCGLEHWEEAPELLSELYRKLLEVMSSEDS